MRADILNAFLTGALGTLTAETKGPVIRTGLKMESGEAVTDEVTVLVSLVGELRGMLLVGMSMKTARQIAAKMVDDPDGGLTEMGFSALAELGNLIAGKAMGALEQSGLSADITPPTIMMGKRTRISTLGLPRFVIPLDTALGSINVHVAADVIKM
ncbi:MAG TPA: chemotaxis protein CheX [Symbiobacteriaceae bacterium]|jgi:chemotaxis protein CheX